MRALPQLMIEQQAVITHVTHKVKEFAPMNIQTTLIITYTRKIIKATDLRMLERFLFFLQEAGTG